MEPISSLYQFPVYQTREEYFARTGKEAPPFNPAKPVKAWEDKSAAAGSGRKVVYPSALALADNGLPLADEKGRPFLEPLILDRADAATVNIPVKDFSGRIQETPTVGIEVPVPCRGLRPDEELVFGFGGLVYVSAAADRSTAVAFTLEDRRLLQRIAEALGVK